MADVLSQVSTQLRPETVRFILDEVTLGMVHQGKVHNPAVLEDDQHVEQEVHVATDSPLLEMYVTNWAKTQREDSMLSTVLDWLEAQRRQT